MEKLINGCALLELKKLESEYINCCVTSPPYWGLRNYGVSGQLGLEKTPEEYVKKIVDIFREVKRVLKNDGTLWLNLGDTYSNHKDCKSTPQSLAKGSNSEKAHVIAKGKNHSRNTKTLKSCGLKNKDLVGIPWMVAFALRADGWYLRQDIIWSKPNPMPESVTDRCTKAHEYIFLLSKSAKYYYDHGIIKEKAQFHKGVVQTNRQSEASKARSLGVSTCADRQGHFKALVDGTRNKRSVWTVNTRPYKEAHFATFPEALIKPCILAGCPKDGIVLDPFNGAGTTGIVCSKNDRDYLGIELNPEYIEISKKRIYNDAPLFTTKL